MRLKHVLLLSGSLLLASCGMQAVPSTPAQAAQTQASAATAVQSTVSSGPSLQTLSVKADSLTVGVPDGATYVTFTLQGNKLPDGQVFQALLKDGQASIDLTGLPKGDPKYTVTVRAYDVPGGVVLYTATTEVNLSSGKVTAPLKFERVKADVTVTASPVLPETTTLTARLGDTTQDMTITAETASTVFKGVATAAGQTVTVTGTTSDGQVTQTGTATFNHTEGGSKVSVTLTTVAHCPVSPSPVTAIGAIQGSGDTSPLLNQVVTVRGIVTGDFQAGLRGFFVQARDGGDGDPATSDGVFVYTGTAPQAVKVGDLVQFTGTVKEFYNSTQVDTLTAFTTCASGLSVKPVELKAPFTDLERYEGMSITIPETLTVTDNYGYGRYGELGLSSDGRLFNPTNGNVTTTAEENAARKIVLDDGNSTQNPANLPYLSSAGTRRTGDTVTGLTGVLHYANNVFKVEPTAAPTFTDANPRPAAPHDVGGTLKVAGANVLNYFTTFGPNDRGANSTFEFQRQQTKIVNALKGLDADIVTLMEVQNNGDTALQSLVTALNAAYGSEVYRAVQTGTVGTDAIKVAIIYKPARVTPIGSAVIDGNTDGIYSRPPVAQTFQDKTTGGVLTVIANHLKSKGSCPTSGDIDTGEGCWNTLRTQQAVKLLAFVDRLKTSTGDQDVLLMGDFNAYGQEKPIQTIVAGGFVSENLRIPAEERYSYQFGGQFGYLDHALASTNLDRQVTGVTEWHINADEPTLADYNVEYKNLPECKTSVCTSPDLWQNNPYRASDHDPVLIGLNLDRDEVRAALSVTLSGADSVSAGQPYTLTAAPSEASSTLSVNWGDGTTDTLTGTTGTHTYASAGTFNVTVTASAGGQTATAQKTVTVTGVTTPTPTTGSLVISEVYGGGGNSGATLTHDFIELFNAGSAPISLAGYSVQYASSSNLTNPFTGVTVLGNVTLAPGQYYLVQEAKGTGGTTALPTPDATGTIAMSGSAGQVALVEGTTAISNKDDARIRDYVAFSNLTSTTSAARSTPCTDTNQPTDFTAGTPTPQNTSSPISVCVK